jgi:hypothetical protein
MSYEIQLKDGLYKLYFYGEPRYCQALEIKPLFLEDFLGKGYWLILLFAVWSIPDRKSINVALNFAKNIRVKSI